MANWKVLRFAYYPAHEAAGAPRSATPFTFAEVMLRHGDNTAGAVLKGVPLERMRSSVAHYFVAGTLVADSSTDLSLAIGSDLATRLGVTVGEHIEIQVSRDPTMGVERDSEFHSARVGAILHAGLAEYDFHFVVTNFDASQALLGRGDVALGIEIALGHETYAQRVANALQSQLGKAGYQVTDWCDLNRALLGCTWRAAAH